MLKELSRRKIGMVLFLTILGVTLITVSVIMTFNTHKNEIIKQQKEQIITTAETAARGLKTFFREKRHGIDLYFNGVVQYIGNEKILKDEMEDILDLYYQKEKEYIYEIEFLTADELKNVPVSFSDKKKDTIYGSYEYQDEGFFVLPLYKPLYLLEELAGAVKVSINLNTVYDEILYPIQIGKKGYCTVKDRNGIILMHGTNSQIGINSREDRKKMHPDLDPVGVDRLVENQIRGESGSDIVDSYWWDNIEAGKVKKIIGYTPVSIVEDFWVVSVIMEYSQIAEILHRTLSMSIVVGFILVVFFGSLIFYITRELKNAQRMHMEWMYERELSETVYQLKKQEEKVQQYDRLQTLGILTGTIAHEFNNLMTPILIYCDLLHIGVKDNKEMLEEVGEIAAAAKRCTELSRQLLDYGRTENVEAKMVVFDAALATKSAVKMLTKLVPGEVRLIPQISKSPVMILGNTGAWNQIVINLCTNAYQAMKEKGGKIHISLFARQNLATLIIEDNGCGIEKNMLETIFEPFFTTKGQGEGTGLGLPVVNRLVKKMKGTITVESKPGNGTTFTLIFPLEPMKADQQETYRADQEEVIKKELRIMILDDKPEIIKSIKKGLAKTRWKTEGYTNPTIAYARLKEQSENFDILLTDDSMPIVNGLELSSIIKKMNPTIKIILMTGYLEKELQEYVDKGIIEAYVLKPITANDITRIVNKLFESM